MVAAVGVSLEFGVGVAGMCQAWADTGGRPGVERAAFSARALVVGPEVDPVVVRHGMERLLLQDDSRVRSRARGEYCCRRSAGDHRHPGPGLEVGGETRRRSPPGRAGARASSTCRPVHFGRVVEGVEVGAASRPGQSGEDGLPGLLRKPPGSLGVVDVAMAMPPQ